MFTKLRKRIADFMTLQAPSDRRRIEVMRQVTTARQLMGYYEDEHTVIIRALKQYNQTMAYGLNPGDVEELCRYFAQYGLPKK